MMTDEVIDIRFYSKSWTQIKTIKTDYKYYRRDDFIEFESKVYKVEGISFWEENEGLLHTSISAYETSNKIRKEQSITLLTNNQKDEISNFVKLTREIISTENLLVSAASIMQKICEHETNCTCGEAYNKRGLVSPNCEKCNGPDYEKVKEWLKEYNKIGKGY